MRKYLFLIVIVISSIVAKAQEIHKGLPADLSAAELLIVQYEVSDLIPDNAKSHASIYFEDSAEKLKKECKRLNAELELMAQNNYPYKYRLIRKNDLKTIKPAHTVYIFEPAPLYSIAGNWSSVVLNIWNFKTGDAYEVGYMPKNGIFSAEQIMENFIGYVPKSSKMQALK